MEVKDKVLVLLWHPEAPYTGGSFVSVEHAFFHHSDVLKRWYVLDKVESNIFKYPLSNFAFYGYKVPRLILFITRLSFALGRLFEWIYLLPVVFFKARNLIKEFDIQVVYIPICELYQLTLIGYLLKIFYGVKLVGIVHQLEDVEDKTLVEHYKTLRHNQVSIFNAVAEVVFSHMFYRFFIYQIKYFNKVAVISSYTKNRLEKLFGFQLTLLNYGFDYRIYDSVKETDKVYDAYYLGRLIPSKGLYDLVRVWKIVTQQLNSAKLLLIGPGSPEFIASLKQRINKEGLAENIIFAGISSGEEKIKLMKSSKIFLFLSHFESYGQVIDEAIACNIPIVSYDLEVYNTRLEYTDYFYMFKKGEDNNIAQKVNDLVRSNSNFVAKKRFSDWDTFTREENKFIFQ